MRATSETEKYLRSKLRSFSKEEIINALIAKLDYTQIDLIAHSCRCTRLIREAEQQEEKERRDREQTKAYIAEYNALVEKVQTKGLESLSIAEVNRMRWLLEKIDEV